MGESGTFGGLSLTGGAIAFVAAAAQQPVHQVLFRNIVSGLANSNTVSALNPAAAVPLPPGALVGIGIALSVIGTGAILID